MRRVLVWWEQLPARRSEVSEKRIFHPGRAWGLNTERMILDAPDAVRTGLLESKLVVFLLVEGLRGAMIGESRIV